MDLFPFTLIRFGGSSYEEWAAMTFDGINDLITIIGQLKKKQESQKEQLCADLFDYIQSLNDTSAQNSIQNLRRDIFNERKLKNNKVQRAKEVLPESLVASLDQYIDTLGQIKEKQLSGEDIYKRAVAEGRAVLKELINKEPLKKGLLLSSKSLLDRIDSFTDRPVDAFRKKEVQVEQSLLQYLTRMYSKTSPFSTFTNLSVATFSDLTDNYSFRTSGKDQQVTGHIRLNNYLLKYLMDLFKSYRDAYLLLPLRCNPTIQNSQDHFLYLTNNNNVESFQRIPFNPVVEHIIEKVGELSDGIVFSNLIKELADEIEASENELEGYLKQLIDFGLLEYNFSVSGVDPNWDKKLPTTLKSLSKGGVGHIDELMEVLKNIRSLGLEYAEANVSKRKVILQQAYDTFRDICMKIHKAAGLPEEERMTQEERIKWWKERKAKEEKDQKSEREEEDKESENEEVAFKHQNSTFFSFKPEQIFYEDTTRVVDATLNKDKFEEIIRSLSQMLNEMRMFKGFADERRKMKDYFIKKYGKESQVEVLTFYEDFFRDVKKPEKEEEERRKKAAAEKKEQQAKLSSDSDRVTEEDSKPEDLPEHVKARNERTKQWRSALQNEVNTVADSFNVELSHLQKANDSVSFTDTEYKSNAYGSFIQFFEEEGRLKAVINSTFPGYGKMMSRFLHIFDDEVTDTIKEWNEKLIGENVFVENCDASYFNANLHPTLMPYEIRMPGSHNSLPSDKQLPVTDFSMAFDPEKDELKLIQKSKNQEAFVFDLGFQGQMGRSQLFQLLGKFSMVEYLSSNPLTSAVNSIESSRRPEKSKEPVIYKLPRIEYENRLVIQRKTWYVPKAILPMKQSGETDWDFFKRVNLWRLKEGMPNEVFVFVNSDRWNSNNTDKKTQKKVARDDYKPQYIDFKNPLLVNLLQKLMDRVPTSMKVEEMLPASDQMLKIDGERFVSEFVVQWYNTKVN